jgi:hypothetical protein
MTRLLQNPKPRAASMSNVTHVACVGSVVIFGAAAGEAFMV